MQRVLTLATLLCAACLDLGATVPDVPATGGADSGRTPPGQPVEVFIRDLKFEPSDITIAAGTTVRWIMEDTGTFHFVTEGDPTATPVFESPQLNVGDSYDHVFDTPGTYVYHCSNHSTIMRGATITVE